MQEIFLFGDCFNLDDYYIKSRDKTDLYNFLKLTKIKTNEELALHINQENLNCLRIKRFQVHIIYKLYVLSNLNIPGIIRLRGFRFPLLPSESVSDKLLKFNERSYRLDLNNALFLMENMKISNLSSIQTEYLQSNGKTHYILNPTIRSKIAFGVAATMKKIHQKNIIFRELKMENVYLDDKLEPRINLLEIFPNRWECYDILYGTPYIMAPEVFMDCDEEETSASDVYSYAIFLYKMFSNIIQFDNKKRIKSSQQLMMNIGKGLRPMKPENIPDSYWELIQKCWKQDQYERPTFDEITEILRSDRFAIEEFGLKTNLDDLHEYQTRIDEDLDKPIKNNTQRENRKNFLLNRKTQFNWKRH